MKIICQGCDTVLENTYTNDDYTSVRPCKNCGREFERMLQAQRDWQVQGALNRTQDDHGRPHLPEYVFIDPAEPPSDQLAMQYLTYNVLALQAELHEMLNETGWKPWSTSNHMNHPAVLSEWIDAWHFMMNILWVISGRSAQGDAGVLAAIVEDRYTAKRRINLKRNAEGYDGVSGKCPNCKRDFMESLCSESQCQDEM